MLIQWFNNNIKALPPQELYIEYKKYRLKNKESYTIAFTIYNFREIVDVFGYNEAINVTDKFVNIIRKHFPEGLIGTLVEGDFILVTNQSITYINQFFNKFIAELTKYYISGRIPVEIKFRSGLSKNDGKDVDEDLKRAVTAMLYQRSESIYVQYYSENIEEQGKEQHKYIDQLDKLIRQKKARNIAVDIITTKNEVSNIKELRLVDEHNQEIFTKNRTPLIKKYGRDNKIDIYNLDYLIDNCHINEKNIYMININFAIIYKNQYLFIDTLRKTAENKNIPNDHICLNINYDNYVDNTMALLYITRSIKDAGFKICLQRLGILQSGYSLVLSSAIEVDYVKVGYDVLIKAMNERRLKVMLKYFVDMYMELDIIPIFTGVSTDGEIEFIESLSSSCLVRKKI